MPLSNGPMILLQNNRVFELSGDAGYILLISHKNEPYFTQRCLRKQLIHFHDKNKFHCIKNTTNITRRFA